jgi:hypothetical protein
VIIALCFLACLVVFLSIAFVAVYFQIIRPMREQLSKQADVIARNAGATIGLYMVNRREINGLSRSVYSQGQKLAFVESYAVPDPVRLLLSCDTAPDTDRKIEPCPSTKRSNREKVAA